MKRISTWLVLGVAAAVVVAQGSGSSVLAAFTKTVNEAQSLNVSYTTQVVGGSAMDYSISLQKPNKARIDGPAQLVIADGQNITTYDKAKKVYFKSPQSAAALSELFKADDLQVWGAFFDPKALGNVVSAKAKPDKTIAGEKLRVVEVQKDAQGRLKVTYFIDSKNMIKRAQHDLADQGVSLTTLQIVRSVDTGSANEEMFAFKAPNGSREVTMEEMMSATWYHDLEEAKQVAAKSNRRIFVDFMAEWCGPCKMLDREVLQTEQWKAYSKYLVFCKIDVDLQPNVAKAYEVTAMPTQMILSADGSVVAKTVGYGGPARFYQFVDANKQ